MKNYAIPLLAATVSAQPGNGAGTKAMDLSKPKPILIATSLYADACISATGAVAAAASVVTTNEGLVATAVAARAALDTAVEDAVAAKVAAITAVTEATTAGAAALSLDDVAQNLELTTRQTLDVAETALTAATVTNAALGVASAAATSTYDTAVLLQAALNTASLAAIAHWDYEVAEEGVAANGPSGIVATGLNLLKEDALDLYNTTDGLTADLLVLYAAQNCLLNGAWGTGDGMTTYASHDLYTAAGGLCLASDTATAGKRQATEYAKQVLDDITAKKALLDTAKAASLIDLGASTAGTPAALDATAIAAVTTAVATQDSAEATWVAYAKLSVKAMAAWNAVEAWAAVGPAGDHCTATKKSGNISGAIADEATCKLECLKYSAWTTSLKTENGQSANQLLPTGSASDGSVADAATSGLVYCYGVEYCDDLANSGATKTCKLIISEVPTASGAQTTDTDCFSRTKSTLATPLIAANTDSVGGGYAALAAYIAFTVTPFTTATTGINAKNELQFATGQLLTIATAYDTKLGTSVTTANDKIGTDTTLHTTANDASVILDGTNATTKGNYDTNVALVASQLILSNIAAANLVSQTTQTASQLAVKTLAAEEKAAQDTLVSTTLLTAKNDAATAKTTHDTGLLATATTTESDAQIAYDAQVLVAAGTATAISGALDALALLRTASDDAVTLLATAVFNQADQEDAIRLANVALDVATAAHLAATVTCKEARFDEYTLAFETAVALRTSNLAKIDALIAADTPAPAGTVGARCEKAMSNGTFRPVRNMAQTEEGLCGTGNCCGAAKIPVGNAVMTIETCQAATATTAPYTAPRAPMQTTANTAVEHPFTCIDGAKKLAAAASALAAAVYVLA